MKKSFITVSLAVLFAGISASAQATNLLEAYKDAITNDPTTLMAKARYNIAKESEKIAFSNLLPSVNLTGGYRIANGDTAVNGQVVEFDSNRMNYGFSISQSIFRMDTWYQLDASEKRALQAQTGYDLAQQGLISRLANAYFNVLKAQDTLEFVEAEKKAIGRQLVQTKEMFKVGLIAITDVHVAQAQYDGVIANEIRSKNNIEIAKEAVREITGKYYPEFAGLNTTKFDAPLPSPLKIKHWVTESENNNLELKSKELLVEATKYDISQAKSGHYPTLNLTANVGGEDNDNGLGMLNSSSVSLNLNVPIYSGGRTTAAVRQAQANYVIASEDMELTHRSVVRQVRSSFADVVALVSSLKALEQSVVSAESALKATQAGFEVGTKTIVDVLLSTSNLYSAKQNLANSRYDYILAMLMLKQASSSLTLADIEAVNRTLAN